MKDSTIIIMALVVMVVMCVVLFVVFTGCASVPANELIPDTAGKVLTKFVLAPDLFFTLTIIGVMAGVFAFLNGQKIGIPLIITCFVGLSMKLAVVRFGFWIGLLGAIGNIMLLTYTIVIKNRALREIVTGVEVYRENSIEHDDFDSIIGVNQSESTEKLVSKVKETL